MLDRSEDAIIDTIIREDGLSEENCLAGLTDQQIRVWVRHALLMEPIENIKAELFSHRKNVTNSTVRYVLHDAALRIMSNILRDADLLYEIQKRPGMRKKVQALIERVGELRKKKGAKVKCRKSTKSN